MATRTSHNKNNSAVKRILAEARELANDPSTDYVAAPLEEDMFEWHCTLRGSPGTEFEGGLYHVRILLPAEYPFRPPAIMLLTPNGRFELNTKICISFTNYHEEQWQPAWGVRTAIIGLQGFFPLKGEAAVGVGAIEYPTSERKRLAQLSRSWTCPHCQVSNLELLPDPPVVEAVAESATESTAEPIAQPTTTVPVSETPIAAHAPSPAPEFIARLPAGTPSGPLSPAELPGPPEFGLTAAVTPFAPQAPIMAQPPVPTPTAVPAQTRPRPRNSVDMQVQVMIHGLDAIIGLLLVCIAYIMLQRLDII